jgi:hypothetical protein
LILGIKRVLIGFRNVCSETLKHDAAPMRLQREFDALMR